MAKTHLWSEGIHVNEYKQKIAKCLTPRQRRPGYRPRVTARKITIGFEQRVFRVYTARLVTPTFGGNSCEQTKLGKKIVLAVAILQTENMGDEI
ncbi:MAG: hypothetical protein H8D23_27535 [Candidatus Brocadiales bacterium]|nr:hypothetical protein [Candidatus Brocadiales bacterium]